MKKRKENSIEIRFFFLLFLDFANKNSDNSQLICALLCGGLYPNIARIRLSSDKSSRRPCLLETKFEKRILIHPRSVNAKIRVNERKFLSISHFSF